MGGGLDRRLPAPTYAHHAIDAKLWRSAPGHFTHRDRRIEFPAGLQHTEAKDQQPVVSPARPAAMRRLRELQTIRDGAVAGLTEWKNRSASSMADDLARSLAERTIQHFTSQLAEVNQAIAEIIDNDQDLLRQTRLVISTIVRARSASADVIGNAARVLGNRGRPDPRPFFALVLVELPEPDVLG